MGGGARKFGGENGDLGAALLGAGPNELGAWLCGKGRGLGKIRLWSGLALKGAMRVEPIPLGRGGAQLVGGAFKRRWSLNKGRGFRLKGQCPF